MTRWLTIPLALLVVLHGAPAAAQMACGSHASLIAQLDMKYGEVRLGWGLAGSSVIIEVWVSEETGTWTILEVYPSGIACVGATGDGWQTDENPKGTQT